jgi:putative DNA primase/helicase
VAAPLPLFPDGVPPEREPTNETVILPPPSAPLDVARVLMKSRTDEAGRFLLRRWRGDWVEYFGPHWVVLDPQNVRKWLYEQTESALYTKKVRNGYEEVPWSPDKGKIDRLLDAMAAVCLLDETVDAPAWLPIGKSAAGYVPCINGLVDVATRQITPATPDYFGLTCIPFTYDPAAGAPTEWLKFLRTLWPPITFVQGVTTEEERTKYTWTQDVTTGVWWRDAEEIRTLRQWFGYVLSGRLDLQKMCLVIGPPRSGKGTIARILRDLVGMANCSFATLALIAQNFGLETSIGKTLMIVGDARLTQQGQEAVIERFLNITGQDSITLDRKYKPAWHGTMATRIIMLSNDLPRFVDASGAIASRNVILRMTASFLGREDTKLEGRLRQEFPAILKWGLDGLVDLNSGVGRFTEPASHTQAMRELYDLVSPITAFLRDVCGNEDGTLNGAIMTPFNDLYHEYASWCRENGRKPKNAAGFSSDLKTKLPSIQTDYRPRIPETDKRMPRQIVGLAITDEWRTRPRTWGY